MANRELTEVKTWLWNTGSEVTEDSLPANPLPQKILYWENLWL
jgi:hypothetical protein